MAYIWGNPFMQNFLKPTQKVCANTKNFKIFCFMGVALLKFSFMKKRFCLIWLRSLKFVMSGSFSFIFQYFHNTPFSCAGTRTVCLRVRTVFIEFLGNDLYYYTIYAFHTVFSHTLPCILLVGFTWKLIAEIRLADRRHAYLVANK